jgi:hypothetical protein
LLSVREKPFRPDWGASMTNICSNSNSSKKKRNLIEYLSDLNKVLI